jgi:hypothetical protein
MKNKTEKKIQRKRKGHGQKISREADIIKRQINETHPYINKGIYASVFLGVALFLTAFFSAGGLAVVLVTRPDLVLPRTLG